MVGTVPAAHGKLTVVYFPVGVTTDAGALRIGTAVQSGGNRAGEINRRIDLRRCDRQCCECNTDRTHYHEAKYLDTTTSFSMMFSTRARFGIAVENLEGQPLFVNPSFCSFLGFSEEELRIKHCVDFSPREDAEKDWELFQVC
jgi:PAS domain-containing protein